MKYIKAIVIYILGYIIAIVTVTLSDSLDKSHLMDIAFGSMIFYLLLENQKK
ncbi:MAG: hypothetical protein IIC75_00355 [Bacteroidetes bacterium]|nr:hypothetical protein [Bacteroidota bacterium]